MSSKELEKLPERLIPVGYWSSLYKAAPIPVEKFTGLLNLYKDIVKNTDLGANEDIHLGVYLNPRTSNSSYILVSYLEDKNSKDKIGPAVEMYFSANLTSEYWDRARDKLIAHYINR